MDLAELNQAELPLWSNLLTTTYVPCTRGLRICQGLLLLSPNAIPPSFCLRRLGQSSPKDRLSLNPYIVGPHSPVRLLLSLSLLSVWYRIRPSPSPSLHLSLTRSVTSPFNPSGSWHAVIVSLLAQSLLTRDLTPLAQSPIHTEHSSTRPFIHSFSLASQAPRPQPLNNSIVVFCIPFQGDASWCLYTYRHILSLTTTTIQKT